MPVAISAGNKSVSINDVSLNEGDSGTTTFTFTVTATDRADGDSVDYATVDGSATTADNDYTAQSGTITFTGNDKTETISINVAGDMNSEPTETFSVILSNPSGGGITNIADGTGTGTIIDDEEKSYTLTLDSIVVDESIGTANMLVRVDPAIYDDTVIIVGYSTSDDSANSGSDYTAKSDTLTISSANTSSGTTTVSIPLTILNDLVAESQEVFHLKLNNNPTITSTLSHTVAVSNDTGDITINDNDGVGTTPTLSVNDVTILEGNDGEYPFMTFTVSLSAIQTQEVIFSYSTHGDTATAAQAIDDSGDFISTSGTATIPPNTSNITISVLIIGDEEAGEVGEQLKFIISTASTVVNLGKDTGIGTIQDDDEGLTLSLNDAAIAERDYDVMANVKIRFSQALNSDLNLTYSTADRTAISPDDYNGTNNDINITIPAGSTEHMLNFTIVGDDILESNEDFNITIESVSTTETIVVAKRSGKVTIFDDDADTGCSTYIGLMTINEYQNNPNYKDDYGHPLANNAGKVPGNYIEIKYLDFLVKQFIDFEDTGDNAWSISIYTTAGSHQLYWYQRDESCIDPRYEVFQMNNNVMGKEGYVVLRDNNDNEVDVLNIANSNHYTQLCHDFIYDTDFDSSAQNKDLFRDPDGTGDWFDHGSGANSGGSRCINRDGFAAGLLFTKFDAIDTGVAPSTPIQDGSSVPIKTKIANEPFYLDILSLEPSTGLLVNSNIKVRTYLADGISGNRLPGIGVNDYIVATFTNNQRVNIGAYNYPSAYKIVRLRFEYCGNDQGAYEDWDQCWLTDDVISQSNRRTSHSRNAFAIRPEKFYFDINSSINYKAGKDYPLTFAAKDGLGSNTQDYNETQGASFNIDLNVTKTSCPVPKLVLSPIIEFMDGLHQDNFRFNDIGEIQYSIHEKQGYEFAIIDAVDTPLTSERLITPGTGTFNVIPDHFDLNISLKDHSDQDFTYLYDFQANNYSMAAVLEANITAKGDDDNITQNYKNNCYAQDTNLIIGFNPFSVSHVSGNADRITMIKYYNPIENNEQNITLPSPQNNIKKFDLNNTASSFTGNGTTTIDYRLNFNRDMTLPVNPIRITLNDANITDTNGTKDKNSVVSPTVREATYFFARARASKEFYDDVADSSTPTPITILSYCDHGMIGCTTFGLNTTIGQIDEYNWWLSMKHNTSNGDGNITLETNATLGSVDSTVSVTSTGKDPNVTVSTTTTTFPYTVYIQIDDSTLSSTSKWLIYNPNGNITPDPFYKVKFIETSKWTGTGVTGHIVDTNASSKKSRRMDW
ncbi:MAG: Calx-beta domain-containing protein [Campylobacterota bacterium]|nr:Calx-beta domain-containing protein [Campylobacterota bacterium]